MIRVFTSMLTSFKLQMHDSEVFQFARWLHGKPKLGALAYRKRGKLQLNFYNADDSGQVQCFRNIGMLANSILSPTPSIKELNKCPKGCDPFVRTTAVVPVLKESILSTDSTEMLINYINTSPKHSCKSCACMTQTTYEIGKNAYFLLLLLDLNRIAANLYFTFNAQTPLKKISQITGRLFLLLLWVIKEEKI